MDNTDKSVLQSLEQNARTPFLQIAKTLKVSEGTIRQRVAKMQKKGIIKKFTIEIGGQTSVMIEVRTDPQVNGKSIIAEMKKLNLSRIYEVTGRIDIVCMATTAGMEQTNDLVDKIRSIKGVVQTETFPILKEN
jgi:DNA-binding Lrp family transcriptional regulator